MTSIKRYTAYDCDVSYFDGYTRGKDIDICGKEFDILINRCFDYSSCFSLIYRPSNNKLTFPVIIGYDNTVDYNQYDKYIIKSGETHNWPGTYGTSYGGIIKYYKCCIQTLEMIYSISNSIFDFEYGENNNPEDPCFYRSDGTVLFASQIHEGQCWLFPRENEDFTDILKAIPWNKTEITIDQYNKCYNDLAVFMNKEDFKNN